MKASEAVSKLLKDNDGRFKVTTLRGKEHVVYLSQDESYVYSDSALPNQKLSLSIFDQITDYISQQGGTVRKGNGHNSKVGYGDCGPGTLMWFIATEIYGHKEGETTYDPIFALAAILDNSGVAKNLYGKIQLTAKYM